MNNLPADLGVDYLLVNSTNEYLEEYSSLSENARFNLTGFSGSTGDALITRDAVYLFVDGRYHIQADTEAKDGITVVKLQLGQKQDDEIKKLLEPNKILGIVAKKVSQKRLESFGGYKIKLLDKDPINDYTEFHGTSYKQAMPPKDFRPENPMFISNLEEVSYITGKRDFSKDFTSKIWSKLYIDGNKQILFNNAGECDDFLSKFEGELIVDKSSINAHDYSLIKKPVHKPSEIALMKSVKSDEEIKAYQDAFDRTDKAMRAVRDYIEAGDNLSEYDIAEKLKEEFKKNGAKSLSFKPITAINRNSALAHYTKCSRNVILTEGSLVLIDCGIYCESGLATDITRVFVKGKPNELQKKIYTKVLKAFLNAFNSELRTGYELDTLAHSILDGGEFKFNHGLGHGIGINVHEAPPNLSQNKAASGEIKDNMTFTIEPGLYHPEYFGVRLENSCYKKNGKTLSFVKFGYEGKLIDYNMLTEREQLWLKDFEIL